MSYWIADGRVMVRSRTERPGTWEIYNWLSQTWEPAPSLEVTYTRSWRRIDAGAALLIAAGAVDEPRQFQ